MSFIRNINNYYNEIMITLIVNSIQFIFNMN